MHPFPYFIGGVLGLGGPEVIIILVIFLVLFGGSKLPELAKGLGKSIKEFKQATREEPESSSAPVPQAAPAAASAPAASSTPATPADKTLGRAG